MIKRILLLVGCICISQAGERSLEKSEFLLRNDLTDHVQNNAYSLYVDEMEMKKVCRIKKDGFLTSALNPEADNIVISRLVERARGVLADGKIRNHDGTELKLVAFTFERRTVSKYRVWIASVFFDQELEKAEGLMNGKNRIIVDVPLDKVRIHLQE